MKLIPDKYYLRRMHIYFSQMLPLIPCLLFSALVYFSFNGFLGIMHRVDQPDISFSAIAGVWSLFSITTILRLMDELKDKEIDRKLFPERPLPSGIVNDKDIVFSIFILTTSFILVNCIFSNSIYFALLLYVYSLLMFKYFFMPDLLRKYLLLNLITHNPIAALMMIYLVILFTDNHEIAAKQLDWIKVTTLVFMYWSIFFSWEISRKIRSDEEENDYVTYSQIFGRIGATLILSTAQTFTFLCGIYFYFSLQFTPLFLVIVCLGYFITMYANLRFLINPGSKTSKLMPFTQKYMLFIVSAMILQQIVLYAGAYK